MKAIVFTTSGDYYQSPVFSCCFIEDVPYVIVFNQTKTNLILQSIWVYQHHQIITLIKFIDYNTKHWIVNEARDYATINFLYNIDLITAISKNTYQTIY